MHISFALEIIFYAIALLLFAACYVTFAWKCFDEGLISQTRISKLKDIVNNLLT